MQTTEPVGASKQAMSKCKANESVKDGTFTRDPIRWAEYVKRLAQLDPGFELLSESHPEHPRQVKHSVCSGWFTMSAPYQTVRFREHIKQCSYSTGMCSTKTLHHHFRVSESDVTQSPSSTTSSHMSVPLPCPGLAEHDNKHISQYFSRTSVASAGGQDIHTVAEALFGVEFQRLSSENKELVRVKQKQTHMWSVDHLLKKIYAIGKLPCEGNAQVAEDGSLRPCQACKALLTTPAFKKAISRKPVPNKNRTFVPHVYQPPEIGTMYRLGFYDLMEGVCCELDSKSNIWLISCKGIQPQRIVNFLCPTSCCREF